ncbi:hypothetical protein PanWU01x14_159380 [Parasponia andersonii]|uniref:Uncharacterized protein n=1 Tax=Parasponia andersonii TaxID=3476 RepID=A0A2P5CEG6_PARAD|nr:hypothetical protein PanWU01x14_159380 [Parasponia andersonii]
MEDEAQKMVALKKAYADIILNTAKEAAARIMVSERKALRFQRDLFASRDESLRMLLRLKQMIDSKTSEAELTSLSQQRRIEELEAQLQEAEDVITDLRAELKRIGNNLEKVKSNPVKLPSGQIAEEDASFSRKSAPFSGSGCEFVATSDMKNIPMNQRVLDDKCCSTMKQMQKLSASDLDNSDANKSDLASIIMRSKKSEQYRNGCTQRIRAFERRLLDGKLPPSGCVNSSNSLMENEFIIKDTNKEECNQFDFKCEKMETDKKLSQGERKKVVKRRTLRRRKTRFGKAKSFRRSHHGQLMKSGQPHSVYLNDRFNEGVCMLSSNGANNVDMTKASDGLQENLLDESCNKDQIKTVYKGKRKTKIKSGNDVDTSSTGLPSQLTKPCEPSPVLSRCRTFAYLGNGGIKSVEDQSIACENEVKMKPLHRLDPGLTLIKSSVNPISGSSGVIDKSGLVDNGAGNDMELTDVCVLVKQESDVEDLRVSRPEFNVETINVSSMNGDLDHTKPSERSNGSPCRVDNNRLLKYTFQRKRKKEATSSPDEIASPEKSPMKRKTVEEHTAPEQQKSTLMDGSSRDSRRLAQVARQLISLSGRRRR